MSDELISVGETLPRLLDAEPLEARKVRLTFKTGEERIVDLAPVLLSRRIFLPLRTDDQAFRAMQVNDYGTAIEWTGQLDLSAAWLARLPSVRFENVDFRRAMDDLGMTLEGMAAALEISRRQVADYRRSKTIPRSIALATRYLLSTRGGAASS